MGLCTLATVPPAVTATAVPAAPAIYQLNSSHTYLSFEADHMGGLLKWRGRFEKSSGTVTLDYITKIGSIDVIVQTDSVDFGLAKMNEHAKSVEIFDTAKHPVTTSKGNLTKFKGDVPTEAEGQLTLRGVTKPTKLQIDAFKYIQHPVPKCEVYGADVKMTSKRDGFGVDYDKAYGFNMEAKLKIQVGGAERDASVAQR